jgi:hypothetical protein
MAQVMVRWRDDASPEFYNEREQEASKLLDFLYFQTPGIYRARQHEIKVTDNVPFAVLAIEEEVELLDY